MLSSHHCKRLKKVSGRDEGEAQHPQTVKKQVSARVSQHSFNISGYV